MYLPKLIKFSGNLTKLWQKQKCSFFDTVCIYIAPWRPKTQTCLEDRQLNQARSNPDTVDQPARTAHTIVHHYAYWWIYDECHLSVGCLETTVSFCTNVRTEYSTTVNFTIPSNMHTSLLALSTSCRHCSRSTIRSWASSVSLNLAICHTDAHKTSNHPRSLFHHHTGQQIYILCPDKNWTPTTSS